MKTREKEEGTLRRVYGGLQPSSIIAIAFLIAIIIGSILLVLPVAHKDGVSVSYADALIMAASSTCVAGLVSVEEGVFASFSTFGYVVIAILMQIGGLGVTSLGVSFVFAINRVSFKSNLLAKDSLNLTTQIDLRKIFVPMLLITFGCEIVGGVVNMLSLMYINLMDPLTAFGVGLFQAISSFNNCGLDILSATSMVEYSIGGSSTNLVMLITSMILTIIGGLGFLVIIDVFVKKFHWKRFGLQTKVVLFMAALLIVCGTLLIFFTSYSPSRGGFTMNFWDALFLSVEARSAGMTSIDLSTVTMGSQAVIMILMFMGAGPGGTGGGIKTTTIAVLFAHTVSEIRGNYAHLFKRTLKDDTIRKALFAFFVFIVFILMFSVLLALCDGQRFDYFSYLFETVSAFGTVGFSLGITSSLTIPAKLVLTLTMYVGRVGPLSISTIWKGNGSQTWKYAEEDIAIG